MATVFERVKKAVGATDPYFDDQVESAIRSAIADMKRNAVNIPDENITASETLGDPLLDRAVILYSRSEFNYDGAAERYRDAYQYLLCSLSLSEGYHHVGGDTP